MTEIRSCAADFARLVAAENAPNRGDSAGLARFIPENQLRGHDEKESDPENSAMSVTLQLLRRNGTRLKSRTRFSVANSLDRRQRHRDLRILIRICELGRAPDNAT